MSASAIFLFVTGSGCAKDATELVREAVAAGWKTYTILTPNVRSVLSPDEIYGVFDSHAIHDYKEPPLDIFPFGTILVAPCTFNTFNKLALDLADNLATSMIADALGANQDLVETYLPSFESSIRDARVASIMCSYNSINGIPACAHQFLLKTIA